MDFYEIMLQQKLASGRGGGDVSVESLSVTENGTYSAEEGHAYSPVIVSVPNSYAASDEGKVVDNGALVGQTSITKTANGTYNTTLNNEVVVNVPGVTPTGNINITSTAQTNVSAYATAQVVDADLVAGNIKKDVDILGVTGTYEGGGGSSYTLLYEDDVFVNTITTTETIRKTINVPAAWTNDRIFVRIRADSPPADSTYYHLGTDNFIVNASTNDSECSVIARLIYRVHNETEVANVYTYAYGIYVKRILNTGDIIICSKYDSTAGSINAIYHIEVYKLAEPNGNPSPLP